jgi:hypothetical protein
MSSPSRKKRTLRKLTPTCRATIAMMEITKKKGFLQNNEAPEDWV